MTERCKHIGKDGYRCGSYAFNLYKDDIDQGELCDVHYWQAKAQRTWVGLTDEEIDHIYTGVRAVYHDVDSYVFCQAIESKLKEKNT
jgi:hypothetical protein